MKEKFYSQNKYLPQNAIYVVSHLYNSFQILVDLLLDIREVNRLPLNIYGKIT